MLRFSSVFSVLAASILLFSCRELDLSDLLGRDDDKMHFVTKLSGANEVPEPVETIATGQLIMEVSENGKKITFTLTVAKLDDYLAGHIHVGGPDENGPVVAWLFPIEPYPFSNFIDDPLVHGTSNGVLTKGVLTKENLVGPLAGMDIEALVDEIKAGNAYVNLHTSAYPAGEIRGNFEGKDD